MKLILPFLLLSCMLSAQTIKPQNDQKPKAIKIMQNTQNSVPKEISDNNSAGGIGTDKTKTNFDKDKNSSSSLSSSSNLESTYSTSSTFLLFLYVNSFPLFREREQNKRPPY